MDRRLQEGACSNSLNNRRLSRRNFEIGDCARPPPPPPPPRNDCPNDTSFLSQRPIIAAHRNAEIVAWKSAVRTRPWQNETERGREGEREKGRGERERKRRRREGGGKRRQFPVSLNKRVHSDASPSARLCVCVVCVCVHARLGATIWQSRFPDNLHPRSSIIDNGTILESVFFFLSFSFWRNASLFFPDRFQKNSFEYPHEGGERSIRIGIRDGRDGWKFFNLTWLWN